MSRIIFATIKDNSQSDNSRWMQIGKINDWIRRYSSTYFIVKGTHGGVHFHLIAGLKKNARPMPKKGIHFCIINLADKIGRGILTREEVDCAREGRERYALYQNQLFDKLTLSLTEYQSSIISKIVLMIKTYHRNKATRVKAKTRRVKVADNIDRIVSYLIKNLEEPRDGCIRKYVDYIEVNK